MRTFPAGIPVPRIAAAAPPSHPGFLSRGYFNIELKTGTTVNRPGPGLSSGGPPGAHDEAAAPAWMMTEAERVGMTSCFSEKERVTVRMNCRPPETLSAFTSLVLLLNPLLTHPGALFYYAH